jgi:lysyl-tRNA synthetase class 2
MYCSFPQMRPELVNTSLDLEMEELDGVPAPWDDVLRKMGIQNKEQLKAVNPNKLFNDLGGMRKKLKLEVAMPSLDDVRQWIG